MILSVPDHSQDFIHFEPGTEEDQDADYEVRKMLADGASVTEALLAAAQIFVYAALREIPPQTKIFSVLLERLRVAIDQPGMSMVARWKEARNLITLLWVLVVASSVATEAYERAWWIGRLSNVVQELGIKSQTELEGVLVRVAWTDVFFGAGIGGVWSDIGTEIRRLEEG